MFGGLPPALSNCTKLMTIDLKRNSFSGNLTEISFSNLINLQKLDLLHNNFTGTIPQSIYSCSNLNALRLARNKLHGHLSLTMANLKSLIFLSLSGNSFTNIISTLHVIKDCETVNSIL
jgi:Leucine-rich repeat (LRR) protein